MAMTGGTAKLVKSSTPSGWSGSVKLYVYYKVASQSIANNTTTLALGMYFTTPSGYWIGAWGDNRGSYIGTATSGANCKTFNGAVPDKTYGPYWLCENLKVTVSHNSDGTGSAKIYWKWGVYSTWGGMLAPNGNFTITLPTIPRTSSLSAPASGKLMEGMTITIDPEADTFRHKLTYTVGNVTGTILDKDSTATSVTWTPPASLASQNTTGTNLSCKLTLETYTSASAADAIGSVIKTVSLTIPATDTFCPTVTPTFTEETVTPNGTFPVLLQNRGKLKAEAEYTMKYGATLKGITLMVVGTNNSASGTTLPLETGYITGAGDNTIHLTITDSRGLQTTIAKTVSILAYSEPTVAPADGESDVRAERCEESGEWNPGGTFLRVKAKAKYVGVMINGYTTVATLRYRYRGSGGTYSEWNEFSGDTGAVEGAYLHPQSTYQVEIGVVDTLGFATSTTLNIGTEAIFMHRTMDALGIGRYVTGRSKVVAINDEWDVETGNVKANGAVTATGNVSGASGAFTGNLASESLTVGGYAVPDYVIDHGVAEKWRYRKWKSGTVEAWHMVPSVRVEGNAILALDVAVPNGIFPEAPGWISAALCSSSTDPQMGLCNVMADSSGHTATTLKLRLTNGDDDYRTPRIMVYAVYYAEQEVIS